MTFPAGFLAWVSWRTNPQAARIPRPPEIPIRVPPPWWPAKAKLLAPPPPPPPAAVPADLPVLFTAWGFDSGFGTFQGVHALCDHAKQAGFRSIACQWGTAGANHAVFDAIRKAGLQPSLWGFVAEYNTPENIVKLRNELQPARVVCQIESVQQADGALELAKLAGNALDIVTTFSGLEHDHPVKERLGVTLVECYVQDEPSHADFTRLMDQARIYGLPNPVPVAGLYGGRGAEAYPQLAARGRSFGVWNAELMAERDWATLGAL